MSRFVFALALAPGRTVAVSASSVPQAIADREQERLRLREVFLYVFAFQQGDFESMGDILERAVQDPILAQMIWETTLELADVTDSGIPGEEPGAPSGALEEEVQIEYVRSGCIQRG